MNKQNQHSEIVSKINYRLFIIFIFISFLGWAFETISLSLYQQQFVDRGFLTFPFCPIYGFSIILTYLIFKTPKAGRINDFVKKYVHSYASEQTISHFLYFLVVSIIASIVELIVGYISNDLMHINLWDYSAYKYNIGGYVCLEFSLLWGILITIFMSLVWPLIVKMINAISDKHIFYISCFFAVLLVFDFSFNIFYLLLTNNHFEIIKNIAFL